MPQTPPVIRIGNGAGFWGDNLDAPFVLARDGRLDVLTLEYLAELTLAILSHLRAGDPSAGYVSDFVELIPRLTPILREQPGLRIVTNAGGLNARACAARCGRSLAEADLPDAPIAVLEGDDVLADVPNWLADGVDLSHMETGEPLDSIAPHLVSASAYLGARQIAAGLTEGARLIVTGRVADASLTVGPAAAHFGWAWDDWPRLAGASVAGHIIECGAQATGGLWHDWDNVPDPAAIGYPIAEVSDDGSSVVTKPEGSGGLVTVATVSEQLVYEIDDPARYRAPDVDVDLTSVSLEDAGPNRVRVSSAVGRAPSDRLKVAGVYRDGWTASGMLAVVGHRAEAKARFCGRLLLDRLKRSGVTFDDSLIECLGAGDVAPGVLGPRGEPFEVVLRVTVRHREKAAVARFCREFAPLITSGPPGLAGYASGRPSPRPAFGYWPMLVPRSLIAERLTIRSAGDWGTEAS